VSDTRTAETDVGGRLVAELLQSAGHQVVDRRIVRDEPDEVRAAVLQLAAQSDVDAVLLTGGTGLSRRDRTFETVSALIDKPLPGYGELFRWLSYQQIGPAAMLSRAVAGLHGQLAVFTMPGSPGAVRLAMERLILPELGHVVREARR
jgi:molybdenum cofactor biosynthesis protein B